MNVGRIYKLAEHYGYDLSDNFRDHERGFTPCGLTGVTCPCPEVLDGLEWTGKTNCKLFEIRG